MSFFDGGVWLVCKRSAMAMAMSGCSERMASAYCGTLILSKPVDVKIERIFDVLPAGVTTAGHLLAARMVRRSEGRAVKLCSRRLAESGVL